MKKTAIILATVFVSAVSFAKVPGSISASAGVGIEPYFYSSGSWNPESLSGVFVRADYEFHFTQVSGLSTGIRLDYLGLGDYAKLSKGSYTFETSWKKLYVDVPVKYNAHFDGFYFNAGPILRILASYSYKETEVTTGESQSYNELKGGNFNLFNLGGGLDLGYVFTTGIRLSAGCEYYFLNGIKNSIENGPDGFKSMFITFGVGYCF